MLSTRRALYKRHGGKMTPRQKGLMEVYGLPLLEVSLADARDTGINGDRRMGITSRRGSLEAKACATDRCRRCGVRQRTFLGAPTIKHRKKSPRLLA